MNIALNARPIKCSRESYRQIKTVQEQAECIVPDVLEDVGQIVQAQAQIFLKSKEITGHTVQIGACADICVFYITENRDRVRSVSMTKSFEIDFESPSVEPDMAVQVFLCSLGVQPRAVNPRKISAQFALRAELSCWSEGNIDLPSDTETGGGAELQLLRKSEEFVNTVQVSEKSFVVNEQLPLEGEEEIMSILCVRADLVYQDHQPIGNKVLIKGSAELSIALEKREGSGPLFRRRSLPFSVLVEMPTDDCMLGRICFEPTALYADLGDAINGSRVLEIELHATAQLCFERKEQIAFLSDAYSISCPVVVEESAIPLCLSSSLEHLGASASDRIPVDPERGEIEESFADILSFSARDGKAELSAAVNLLLRTKEGAYGTQQRLLSAECELPAQGGEITSARIVSFSAVRLGEEISLDLSAILECAQNEQKELRYLSAIEMDTEKAFDPSSIPALSLVRRRDRDLWELAKQYHSSVGAIEQMSEKYSLEGDLILIPRA